MSTRGSLSTISLTWANTMPSLEGRRLDDGRRVLGVGRRCRGCPRGRPWPRAISATLRRQVDVSSGRRARCRCGWRRPGSCLAFTRSRDARCPAGPRSRSRPGGRCPSRRGRYGPAARCTDSPGAGRARSFGSSVASASARKSACFWLSPSRQTRSPGSSTASSSATASACATALPPACAAAARSRRARRRRARWSQAGLVARSTAVSSVRARRPLRVGGSAGARERRRRGPPAAAKPSRWSGRSR